MMSMMGIPFGFDSTQGKHVEDEASNAGGVKSKGEEASEAIHEPAWRFQQAVAC